MARPSSVAQHGSKSRASLSIVVLSTGSRADLEQAIEVMAPSIRRFGAQLVVAREDDGMSATSFLHDHPKASLVRAPKGATRAQLCDVGMAAATGDIVALRDDRAVRDCHWLECFASAVRCVESEAEVTVANYSDFSVGESELAMIDAAMRKPHGGNRGLPGAEAPTRLSVPLSDRRADPKRAIARDA